MIWKLLKSLWREPAIEYNIPPVANYEDGVKDLTDLELARKIRHTAMLMAYSKRFYDERVKSDADDPLLESGFLCETAHYPTRARRLKEIWDSGVLDDHANAVFEPFQKKFRDAANPPPSPHV